MQNTYSQDVRQVAIIAWNGMDLTDFVGPLEALSHARNEKRERYYQVTIAADTESSSTSQDASIGRHIDIATLLKDIFKYDVLIIPGGGGFSADNIPKAPGIPEALKAFNKLPSLAEKPRVIMSICAGVFFLAQEGLLKGRNATGHPLFLGELKKLCDRNGGSNVIRQHYVDAGIINSGVRVITSGGITSGFDSTLYLIEQEQGSQCAEMARTIMDANWRKETLPFGFV